MKNINVLFLDYDGVVNIPRWEYSEEKGWFLKYNWPVDNAVNNRQAVQWISDFCIRFSYDIVVSSTWREDDNYKECLINAGLREGVKIIGCTPILFKQRGEEISAWLAEHPETEGYLIVDDDNDMTIHLGRLIQTRHDVGFMQEDYVQAQRLHHAFNARD